MPLRAKRDKWGNSGEARGARGKKGKATRDLKIIVNLGGCAQKRATQAAAGIYLIFSAS